eukprot:scaffold311014_cov19-Tisochrysis_lutea.AAC.1
MIQTAWATRPTHYAALVCYASLPALSALDPSETLGFCLPCTSFNQFGYPLVAPHLELLPLDTWLCKGLLCFDIQPSAHPLPAAPADKDDGKDDSKHKRKHHSSKAKKVGAQGRSISGIQTDRMSTQVGVAVNEAVGQKYP